MLSYLLVGFMWIVLAHSPWWEKNLTPTLERMFFRVDQLHPLLKKAQAIEILSSNDVASIRNISQLIKDDKRYTRLEETKVAYSI